MEQNEDLGANSGSRASIEPASRLDPLGFDPGRWFPEQRSFAKAIADEIVRDAGGFGLGGAAIHAGAMIAAGRIWLRENPNAAQPTGDLG